MTFLLPFVLRYWRYLAIAGALLALLLALWGFVAHERHLGRIQAEAAAAQAVAEAKVKNDAALAQAAQQRAVDLANTAKLEKALTDAYAKTPDSKPSAARINLACARLRHENGVGGKLPAVCGPQG